MKTLTILGVIAVAIGIVAVGAWAGSLWAQERWTSNRMAYGVSDYGTMGPIGVGPGMMGANRDWDEMPYGSAEDMPCDQECAVPGEGDVSSLEGVETAVHDYVDRLGYSDLEVTEAMEFERNYYAIVAEQDTGIGAMELLVDKDSGAIGLEPGPNMMWNAKYGMMGSVRMGSGMMGMMDGYASGEMTLSPQEAEDVAQRWLDANLPGRTAGDADQFYGYYTLHFLNDGQIEGMLSVHGSSGDVWYHSWHGDFVAMTEGHG